jgi:hypothetical protein
MAMVAMKERQRKSGDGGGDKKRKEEGREKEGIR